jgi:hypothetical protein
MNNQRVVHDIHWPLYKNARFAAEDEKRTELEAKNSGEEMNETYGGVEYKREWNEGNEAGEESRERNEKASPVTFQSKVLAWRDLRPTSCRRGWVQTESCLNLWVAPPT